jgi:hypothetical protein
MEEAGYAADGDACRDWANAGYCDNEEYAEYMQVSFSAFSLLYTGGGDKIDAVLPLSSRGAKPHGEPDHADAPAWRRKPRGVRAPPA